MSFSVRAFGRESEPSPPPISATRRWAYAGGMLQNSFERNEASLRCFDCCRSRRRSSRSTQEGWYRPSSGGGGMLSVRRWYTLAMFPLPPSPSYRKVNSA